MGRQDAGSGKTRQRQGGGKGQMHKAPVTKYRHDIGREFEKRSSKFVKKEVQGHQASKELNRGMVTLTNILLVVVVLIFFGAYGVVIYLNRQAS